MTGNALRRARAWLGYTQPEMARAIGVSLATYQRREALADEAIPKAEAFMVRAMTHTPASPIEPHKPSTTRRTET